MKPKKLISLCTLFLCCAMGPSTDPKEILLWPAGAPGSEQSAGPELLRISDQGDQVLTHVNKPSILPLLPALNKSTGAAIIIAPGGGHAELWISHEGYSPAKWFQEQGIACFVLKYRLANEKNSIYTVDKDEVADIQRAIRLVRSRAREWHLDTARIGVMGFSAGGELAALAAMRYSTTNPDAKDEIDRQSDKPDFQALIYPGNIHRLEVGKNAPPVFIAAGYKDRPEIAEGVAELYLKYKKAEIPAELHIYGSTGHGFGIRKTNSGSYTEWTRQVKLWLGDLGMLAKK